MLSPALRHVLFTKPRLTLREAIIRAGVFNGLKLCLDAGDIQSIASGSGTKWLDTSGNGYDFFRGADITADTDDPTHNGTVGGCSKNEYWSFDGGDFFTYDTTNETWMQNLHKNNAKISFVAWLYVIDTSHHVLFSNVENPALGTGVALYVGTPNLALNFIVVNAGTEALGAGTTSDSLFANTSAWNFVGMSLDEAVGAGGIKWNLNGIAATDTSTYVSPSTGDASFTVRLACNADPSDIFPSGSRLAMLAVWEGTALTAGDLSRIYQATRGRFGV